MKVDGSKELIISIACTLFYDRGYNSTTFQDIADRCNVTKQAITYHFGSKANLGRAVTLVYSNRISSEFRRKMLEQLGRVDELTLSAAYLIWYSAYYRNDKNFLRYFDEFILTDAHFDDVASDVASEYNLTFAPVSNQTLTEFDIKIKTISAFYAGKGLLHQYSTGRLNCSDDEFAWYLYLNYFSPHIDNPDDLQRIFRQAREAISKTKDINITLVD